MKIILMRHGQADPGEQDFLRPLSTEGGIEAQATAKKIAQLDFKIDRIISSPLLRAKQTRQNVMDQLSYHPEQLISNFLMPESDPSFWIGELRLLDINVMLIGHLPFMGILAGHLLGMPSIGFNTADALVLERENGNYFIVEHLSCC